MVGIKRGVAVAVWVGLAAVGGLWGIGAFGSACCDTSPSWTLAKTGYDSYGNSAVLVPGNDTRVNLLLLLADQGGTLDLRPAEGAANRTFFAWKELAARASPVPPATSNDWVEPSRCQTNASGTTAFIAAVRANPDLDPSEAQALIAARQALRPDCQSDGEGTAYPAFRSAAAQSFVTYLEGAEDFYHGDFEAAANRFARLAGAKDPWLKETALYMAARAQLNRAQLSAFDEYGTLAEPAKRDAVAIAAAGAGFTAYLRAFPRGRYAGSATGLMRRVHWLGGSEAELSSAYGELFRRMRGPDASLVNEIDLKLLEAGDRGRVRDPILLAVSDLQRMRSEGSTIDKAEIEGQRAAFGKQRELYDYVRAAEAYFVRQQPAEVLKIIPSEDRRPRFTYLQFSRQMLRGLALEALGRAEARNHLIGMFAGAAQPLQREALELALAMHDERSGRLDAVFAAGSPVRNPYIREILLSYTAGPDLLRQQARAANAPVREREAALYILLSKELSAGLYRSFLDDVRLVPAGAPSDGSYSGAELTGIDYNPAGERIPLGIFTRTETAGGFGCPRLVDTVGTLAQAPRANGARLCLAEFMRVNGYDWFAYDKPLMSGGLASTPSRFPGGGYSRLEVYKSVIADPAATAADKSFALYRAVRCYAPSGSNSCGGGEVELGQRRAWFLQLKRDYPQSRWARELQYYW